MKKKKNSVKYVNSEGRKGVAMMIIYGKHGNGGNNNNGDLS